MRSFFSPALFTFLAATFVLPGCGSDPATGSSSTGDDGGDGKYHPPGNGKRISEDTACQALSNAQDLTTQALVCTATTRPCPSLVQVMFGVACLEYDEGSVQGCIDYYAKQTTCDELGLAISDCVVTSFEGSEPGGCP